MSNCTKCQFDLEVGSNFCRKCGTQQVETKNSDLEVETKKFSTEELGAKPTAMADYTTTKMDTRQIALTPPAQPPVAATTPMTEIIQQKKPTSFLLNGIIFFLIGAISAGIGFSAITYIREEKALKNDTKKPITKPVAKVLISPTPTPDKEEDTSEVEINEVEQIDETDEINNSEGETPTPKPVEKEAKPQPLPTSPAKISPPVPIEKEVEKPKNTPKPEPKKPDLENEQVSDGVLSVRFRLVGKAIVRMRGSDISVIPLENSSVMDVNRRVANPLPFKKSLISVRQRTSDSALVRVLEKPSRRNNFAATFAVESTASNPDQAISIDLAIRWQTQDSK
ncbi:MAG: hypothetical protein JNM06_16630 [Blastocatellia bacterium]|nr:hypothetical protein [Blastocatellia bacterium]MBN8722690.1 hypothetical protein [Acidobacteriota bacterium]